VSRSESWPATDATAAPAATLRNAERRERFDFIARMWV